MLKFITKHWQYVLVLGMVVGSFFVGRLTVPTEIVEVEKRVVIEKEREQVNIVQTIDMNELLKQIENQVLKKDIRRTVVVIEKPDGSKETTTSEVDKTVVENSKETDKATDTKKTEVVEVIKEVVKYETKEVLVERRVRTNWSVTAGVGYDVQGLLNRPQLNLIPVTNLIGIVSVDKRLVGDLWTGVWGTTTGTVGVQVGVKF